MFANIYDAEEPTVTQFSDLVPESTKTHFASGSHVLVPDSDNDDSLGLPPAMPTPTSAATPPPHPRAFSKRAAKCAAELLRQHERSHSAAQQDRCMRQLRRLGGAYQPLGQGHAPTVWLRYADLNARVIRETEAYFDGRLGDRLTAPQVTRRNGALSATSKAAVQLSMVSPNKQLLGARTPLPSLHANSSVVTQTMKSADDFTLSRGEQFALSLLSMEDGADSDATRQPMPTYLLRKDARGDLQRVSISTASLSARSFGGTGPIDAVGAVSPLHHCWLYDDDADHEDGLSSVQTSPSAAHSTDSPGAAVGQRKRSRVSDEAPPAKRPRPAISASSLTSRRLAFDSDVRGSRTQSSNLDDDAISLRTFSVASSSFPTPKSLSATVIEQRNHRVQWSLLQQQSLFTPF